MLVPDTPFVVSKEETENYVAQQFQIVHESRFVVDQRTYLYAAWCALQRMFILFASPLSLAAFAPNGERLRKLSRDTDRYRLLTAPTLRWSHLETWVKGSAREYVLDRVSQITQALEAAGFRNADTKIAAVKFPKGIDTAARNAFNQRMLHRRNPEKRKESNRKYQQANPERTREVAKINRKTRTQATVAADCRRRGKEFLNLASNAALRIMGAFEELVFPAPAISNPRAARRVDRAHCFFDVGGNMHYYEDEGANIISLARLIASQRTTNPSLELSFDKGLLGPGNRGSIEIVGAAVSVPEVLAAASCGSCRGDSGNPDGGSRTVPPEVAVLNYWGCVNRPSLSAVEAALGADALSRCIFGLVSPRTRHVAVMEGLHRADTAFDLDQLRRAGTAGFSRAWLRSPGVDDEPFDRQAVQAGRERLLAGKAFSLPRSRAMLDLLVQPDLAVEILAIVPPHGSEEVSREILFKVHRNFAVNLYPSMWRTARKSYAPTAFPRYAYDFYLCHDPADPSREVLLRSLGPVEEYVRGVARLEALDPTFRTGIPALVPAQLLKRMENATLTDLDAYERSVVREKQIANVVIGKEASRQRVFAVTSASRRKFYLGLTDMSPADKMRSLRQHFSSHMRGGRDKYQKAFDVLQGSDAEIAILGREYTELTHEEEKAALKCYEQPFLDRGWTHAEEKTPGEEKGGPRHTTIYKIAAIAAGGTPPACYIGHTTMRFEERMACHREGRHPTIADALIKGPHTTEILAEGMMGRAEALAAEARFIYRFRETAINVRDPRLEDAGATTPEIRNRIIAIRNEDAEDHKVNLRRIVTCRSFLETIVGAAEPSPQGEVTAASPAAGIAFGAARPGPEGASPAQTSE
jgi:hypothetical protein